MLVESSDPGQPTFLVKLNPYRLAPDVFARHLVAYGLLKYLAIWLYMGFAFGVLVFAMTHDLAAGVTLGACIFVLFGLLARWAAGNGAQKSRLNRNLWAGSEAEFDDYEYRVWSSSGTSSKIPFRNIVKVDRFRQTYLLFLTAGQYLLVPESAFKSQTDERKFQEILVKNSLLKAVDR